MLLKKDMILTIDILSVLSENPTSLVSVAVKTGTTFHYVHKIVKKMRKKGWVSSKRGPNGGLMCVPRFLSLRDIIELWEGSNKIKKGDTGAAIAYEQWLIAAEQINIRTFGG